MNSRSWKMGVGVAVIVLVFAGLAYSGFDESKAYYKYVDELDAMGQRAYTENLKVHGNVVLGSIVRTSTDLEFVLERNGRSLPVKYIGRSPIPDTFKDGIEAVVDGRLKEDGEFHATLIQAKCASKYEADYNQLKPQN